MLMDKLITAKRHLHTIMKNAVDSFELKGSILCVSPDEVTLKHLIETVDDIFKAVGTDGSEEAIDELSKELGDYNAD